MPDTKESLPLPETAREVLNLIDRFLCKGSVESMRLINVLSAVRGPDSQDRSLKSATTAIIRANAFPLLYAQEKVRDRKSFTINYADGSTIERYVKDPAVYGLSIIEMREGNEVVLPYEKDGQSHFSAHIRSAASALFLDLKMEGRKE